MQMVVVENGERPLVVGGDAAEPGDRRPERSESKLARCAC
jgi:hypothetical protein